MAGEYRTVFISPACILITLYAVTFISAGNVAHF